MSRPYSFPLPEAMEKHLERRLGTLHPRPHSWKRYIDADSHDHLLENDEPRLWPPVFNPFLEWHKRNGALGQLLREAINRHNQSDQIEKLNALIAAVEHAFEDFPALWEWATTAWEYDPDIEEYYRQGMDSGKSVFLACLDGMGKAEPSEVAEQEGGK